MAIGTQIISLAPLQGFTEFPYRNAMQKIIGGVDKYYTPYLRLQNDGSLKKKDIKDVLPENNTITVIPQILVNNSPDFIQLANFLSDFGYKELNLNLGCPYPMVTNRDLGAGLLKQPDRIIQMLDESIAKINISVSLKVRSGLYNAKEIMALLPQLNIFPLNEIIIHPRIAKQLYRGYANKEVFEECLSLTKHKLAYNGDIGSLHEFNEIKALFGTINHFMIGRGLLFNPFLAQEIKNNKEYSTFEKQQKLIDFHNFIYNSYKQATSGFSHFHNKMLQFWIYFAYSFSEAKKIIKSIKKCKTENAYLNITNSIFKT